MAVSVSSYEIIFPDSRQIVIVNARPSECVDNRLIIKSSPAMIQWYQDIKSMLKDDGGHAYTTSLMELKTTNDGSVVTLIPLDGSNHVLDYETCVMVTNYIMQFESLRAEQVSEDMIHEHSLKIDGNSDEEKEEEVCVICQGEFQTGEMCAALECEHGYHKECIEKWLQTKNDCPVCRAEVFPFLSKICMFRVGS